MYLEFKPGCASGTEDAIAAMKLCVNEIRAWMLCDKLMINDGKTEVIIIDNRQQLSKVHIDSLAVGDAQVSPVQSVKNLGTWIDSNMCLRIPRFYHISPILRKLHWLPVEFRIQFKIIIITFKVIHGQAPVYLQELISQKEEKRYNLRLCAMGIMLQSAKNFN